MTRFGVALGAQKETYAGLAGMGDLIATCMSPHGRNRAAGQKLAEGKTSSYMISSSIGLKLNSCSGVNFIMR